MAIILWTKHDVDIREREAQSRPAKYKLHRPKISETLVLKLLKIGSEFLSTLSILFRPQSIAYALSGITVSSIVCGILSPY